MVNCVRQCELSLLSLKYLDNKIISTHFSLIQWLYVLSQLNVLLQDVLQKALEEVEAKHKNLKEKQR
jgi:hypothetical protein